MTHATITPHDRHCAVTMTGYSPAHKEAVKALAGAEYIGGAWIVSVLHLPTLKAIFDTMTVAKVQPAELSEAGDPALTVWLAGTKNAHKAAERKERIVKARRRTNKSNTRKKGITA